MTSPKDHSRSFEAMVPKQQERCNTAIYMIPYSWDNLQPLAYLTHAICSESLFYLPSSKDLRRKTFRSRDCNRDVVFSRPWRDLTRCQALLVLSNHLMAFEERQSNVWLSLVSQEVVWSCDTTRCPGCPGTCLGGAILVTSSILAALSSEKGQGKSRMLQLQD